MAQARRAKRVLKPSTVRVHQKPPPSVSSNRAVDRLAEITGELEDVARELTPYVLEEIYETGSANTHRYAIQNQISVRVDLIDIEDNVDRFEDEIEISQNRDGRVLCVLVEGADPIAVDSREALASVQTNSDLGRRVLGSSQPWNDVGLTGEVISRSGLRIEVLNASEAIEAFKRNLTRFMNTRLLGALLDQLLPLNLEGQEDSPNAPAGPGTRLQFEVHADVDGLRIYGCGACLHRNNGEYFDSPSSPVTNVLRPGRYIFGGCREGAPRWDDTEYQIPHQEKADLRIAHLL